MNTVRAALRMYWAALAECDERDHMECRRHRHQLGREHARAEGFFIVYPKACPTCGDEIVHRPRRSTMLNLAKIALKTALWPRWVTVDPYGTQGSSRRELWWRGHVLQSRVIPVRRPR